MKFGDPIIYHLDDGDVAPGMYEHSIGDIGHVIRVFFSPEMAAKYRDKDGWFSGEFMDHYKNCVTECGPQGTQPGEWEPR